jgi:hypothetical protein
MGSTHLLDQAAAIERAVAVAALQKLLADVVPADQLRPYSELMGHQRTMEPLGNTADALDRIRLDHAATDMFAVSMLAGALVRVVAAQQERIEQLEASKSKAGAKK